MTKNALLSVTVAGLFVAFAACDDSSSSPPATTFTGSDSGGFSAESSADSGPGADGSITVADAGTDATPDAADAGKILATGLLDPIPYLSRADSPFNGVAFPSYFHFEDWEDAVLDTPGVTASSTTLSSSFGPSLIDSVDGDDGAVNGSCAKTGATCDALFGNGSITFTFDAAVLGALPSHVGLAWTDGASNCDAIFEAYDAADVLIGIKTAVGVGDADNSGGTAEDRFFGVVYPAGVKKIIMKSSAGGVEVDHLTYGR